MQRTQLKIRRTRPITPTGTIQNKWTALSDIIFVVERERDEEDNENGGGGPPFMMPRVFRTLGFEVRGGLLRAHQEAASSDTVTGVLGVEYNESVYGGLELASLYRDLLRSSIRAIPVGT